MLARGCPRSLSRARWGWRRQACLFATAPHQPTKRTPLPTHIDGPTLRDFLQSERTPSDEDVEASAPAPYLTNHTPGAGRFVDHPIPS